MDNEEKNGYNGYDRADSRNNNGYRRDGDDQSYASREAGEQRYYRPRYSESDQERPYRPRYGNDGQQQQSYRPRYSNDGQQQSYRPRYGNDGQQQSYRPRYGNDGQQQSYRPRYNNDGQQQSYRPRYNNDGQQQRPYRQNNYNNNGQQQDEQRPFRPRFNNGGRQGEHRSFNDQNNRNNRNFNRGSNGPGNRRQGSNRPMTPRQHWKFAENVKRTARNRIDGKLFDNEAEMTLNGMDPERMGMPETLRLNRYIAMSGVCSRREADELIKKGVITVNGNVVTEMGVTVSPNDLVEYEGKALKAEKKVYVLLNKPKDAVTTTDDPEGRRTVMDIVANACEERIYPVGRLDRNTLGVLLLTNDGDMAEKLMHPKYEVRKIYHVFLDKEVAEEHLDEIVKGVELEDGPVNADEISFVDHRDRTQVGIVIHSGRNRIVRRIFEHFGYNVEKLDRVSYGGLTKMNVPRGHWRYLSDEEVNRLKAGFVK